MSAASGNVSVSYVDLATYDELERFMYGGPEAITYFIATITISTWFTLALTQLPRIVQAGWDGEFSAQIVRSADYLLNVFVRGEVGAVTAASGHKVRWSPNFAHNLFSESAITFNELGLQTLQSVFFDFWTAFTVPAEKREIYDAQVGNRAALTEHGSSLPAFTFIVHLPLFFSRHSGVGLPTAALPYNDMKLNFHTRKWEDLLVVHNSTGVVATTSETVTHAPTLRKVEVWSEYALVSADERKKMGCAPRDVLIEQVQYTSKPSFAANVAGSTVSLDLRFAGAIKAIFFGVRNKTRVSDRSNYALGVVSETGQVNDMGLLDPISTVSLNYEGTSKLTNVPADIFSFALPYIRAPAVPTAPGYHLLPQSLDLYSIEPKGSTNYSKLANVTMIFTAHDSAVLDGIPESVVPEDSKYEAFAIGIANTVIRIQAGSIGIPVF